MYTCTHDERCTYDGFAGCCHIEAAEEREAFLRALMEEQEEAGDGRRKLTSGTAGWTRDESRRMREMWRSDAVLKSEQSGPVLKAEREEMAARKQAAVSAGIVT